MSVLKCARVCACVHVCVCVCVCVCVISCIIGRPTGGSKGVCALAKGAQWFLLAD